jgi:hypothetical protein
LLRLAIAPFTRAMLEATASPAIPLSSGVMVEASAVAIAITSYQKRI